MAGRAELDGVGGVLGSLADCALNVTTSFVVPEKRAAVRFTTYQRPTFFLRVQAITTITRNTNKGNKPTSKAMSAMTKARKVRRDEAADLPTPTRFDPNMTEI